MAFAPTSGTLLRAYRTPATCPMLSKPLLVRIVYYEFRGGHEMDSPRIRRVVRIIASSFTPAPTGPIRKSNRRFTATISTTVLMVSVLLAVPAAGQAIHQPSGPAVPTAEPLNLAPEEARLQFEEDEGGLSAQAVDPVCWGRSDDPHASNHVPGTIAAQGHTFCDQKVQSVYVTSRLYRIDWLAGSVLVDEDFSRCTDCSAARVVVSTQCDLVPYEYEIYSEHIVYLYDGRRGYGATWNENVVAC